MARDQEARVLVAVPTFRRLEALAELLPELVGQAAEAGARGHDVRVVVVDNDDQQGARPVVSRFRPDVMYVSEPRPGVAAARNAALDAGRDSDLLVFIDDDEHPRPHWLTTLIGHWHLRHPAAVLGPVVPSLEHSVDAWTDGTAVFVRPRHPTGTTRNALNSGNVLLDLAFLRRHLLRFDEDFGLTGGEDSLLGKQLLARGGTIEWCDEAVVIEDVPAQRQERRWVRQRLMRQGETWARVRLRPDVIDPATGPRTRARFIATGAARMAIGTLGAAGARLRSDQGRLGVAEARFWGGVGMVRGSLGLNRRMYHL